MRKDISDFLPQVERALGYANTYNVAEMAVEILEGRAQLWDENGAMIVTQLDYKPRETILRFWIAAGDLQDVLKLANKVYEWGRELGCKRAMFIGRKGWTKPLTAHGWEADKRMVLFEKEL